MLRLLIAIALTLATSSALAQKYDIPIDESPVRGDINAKNTIVLFTAFEKSLNARVHRLLKKSFGKGQNDTKVVYKHLPSHFNLHSTKFAIAADVAHKESTTKYWAFVDSLYENIKSVNDQTNTNEHILKTAQSVGLKIGPIKTALKAPQKHSAMLKRDKALAATLKLRSAPALFVNGKRTYQFNVEGILKIINERQESENLAPLMTVNGIEVVHPLTSRRLYAERESSMRIKIKQMFYSKLLDQELIRQEAKRLNIAFEAPELKKTSEAQDKHDFFHHKALKEKVMARLIKESPHKIDTVSEKEMAQARKSMAKKNEARVSVVSTIYIHAPYNLSANEHAKKKALAQKIAKQANEGQDFAELRRIYNENHKAKDPLRGPALKSFKKDKIIGPNRQREYFAVSKVLELTTQKSTASANKTQRGIKARKRGAFVRAQMKRLRTEAKVIYHDAEMTAFVNETKKAK